MQQPDPPSLGLCKVFFDKRAQWRRASSGHLARISLERDIPQKRDLGARNLEVDCGVWSGGDSVEEGEPEMGLTHQRTMWWENLQNPPKIPTDAPQGRVTLSSVD